MGRQRLQFFPAPFRAPLRAFAALLFPFDGHKVLLCNIADRGWCIPSGRVEPGESSLEAVVREAWEEAGAIIHDLQYIGCYSISERGEVRWADCFTARVDELVEIGFQTESLGRQTVCLEELPKVYYQWNELTARVFEHALQVIRRQDNQRGAAPVARAFNLDSADLAE
jgi:8-oxo-dGTP diphosphatase